MNGAPNLHAEIRTKPYGQYLPQYQLVRTTAVQLSRSLFRTSLQRLVLEIGEGHLTSRLRFGEGPSAILLLLRYHEVTNRRSNRTMTMMKTLTRICLEWSDAI